MSGGRLDGGFMARAARVFSSELALADLQRAVLRLLEEASGARYAALVDFTGEGGGRILCQSDGERRAFEDLHDSVPRHPLVHGARNHGWVYLKDTLALDAAEDDRQGLLELLVAQASLALDHAWLRQHLAEQTRTQEASRRDMWVSRKQLQELVDHSPAAIYVKDREGRYLLVNRVFERFYGATREHVVGRKDTDLLPAEVVQQIMENDRRVLTSGATIQFEEELPWQDGIHTFVSAKFPLHAEDGSVHAICGISTDITDRKRAERSLQRAHDELEQRVNERTEQLHAAQQELMDSARHAGMVEIANSILHNLGNALTGISVSSTLLRERLQGLPTGTLGRVAALFESPPEEWRAVLAQDERGRQLPVFLSQLHARFEEEQRHLLEECAALATKVEHANSVVTTQQTYARTRTSLCETLRLRELVEDALRLCSIGDQFDQLIQRDYGEEEPALYERHLLVQILVNLISNAKNAVREQAGSQPPRITLSVRQTADRSVVTVQDNGVGFDESIRARLFTYGFTTRAKGHGFGLHSAALSAQSLGGTLEAHSDGPGQGARFELSLPRTRGLP